MSLGRLLLDLARANLAALLERAAEVGPHAPGITNLADLPDETLLRELERRRRSKKRRERATRAHRPVAAARENKIAEYYAALEVPYGSDLGAVKRAYRHLMRREHPDRQAKDAVQQSRATSRAQALATAYAALEQALKTRGATRDRPSRRGQSRP